MQFRFKLYYIVKLALFFQINVFLTAFIYLFLMCYLLRVYMMEIFIRTNLFIGGHKRNAYYLKNLRFFKMSKFHDRVILLPNVMGRLFCFSSIRRKPHIQNEDCKRSILLFMLEMFFVTELCFVFALIILLSTLC